MTTRVSIAVEPVSDRQRAVATVVAAFIADPVVRWVFPDAATYLAHSPELVRRFGGKAFDEGSAYSAEDYAGIALWLPPGVSVDEGPLVGLLEASVAPGRLENLFGVLEQMSTYHPTEPHWYLPMVGVDPVWQGKGYGSALLRHTLARCDEEGRRAYLESSNPANLPLYERHGFRVMGKIQVGDSPPIWPMLREPAA
jgi:ribosomal protein S18 acetylase RimI-like enzyme